VSLLSDLARAVGPGQVISDPAALRTYESDALTGYRAVPQAVVLPGSTAEVSAAVRVCTDHGIPFVARGAGTGLSGGAVPVAEGIVIGLARMNGILEVDVPNRRVRL
jgi:glycolate oxidase